MFPQREVTVLVVMGLMSAFNALQLQARLFPVFIVRLGSPPEPL
jgi:hypothetical protein